MNVYEQVTDNIVRMLEQGDIPPWRKDWSDSSNGLPYNGVTQHQYKGVNIWNLFLTALDKGYMSNQWATYKQWQSAGGQVRKGEKSTTAVFFKPLVKTDDSGNDYQIHIARSFHVFNRDQVNIEPCPETPQNVHTEDLHLEGISLEMVSSLSVKLSEGPPAYSRTTDTITMPNKKSFTSMASYYSTMSHECSHSTGHDKRLSRNMGKRFGDDEYAMEELVAELSAAYLCAKNNVQYDLQQHASYLHHWIKRLKEDSKAIFNVAAASQRAADYISYEIAAYRLVNEQESELSKLIGG